jgi:molecular chaperone DnaJ
MSWVALPIGRRPGSFRKFNMPDYYKILAVDRAVDPAELKVAYRRMALKFHPDQNLGDPLAVPRFQLISEAYQVLSEPERRRFYDRFGVPKEAVQGLVPRGAGMGQLLDSLLDEVLRRPRKKPARGRDRRYTLEVSFREAALGALRTIQVLCERECGACGGHGALDHSFVETCHVCGGTGEVKEPQALVRLRKDCPFCGGSGKLVLRTCATCGGTGTSAREEELSVRLPPGTTEGKTFRYRGYGEPGSNGGDDGDLLVVVSVAPQPFYRREGFDIVTSVPVTVPEALLGGRLTVPTVDGAVRIRLPAGATHGQRLRIAGRGVPRPDGSRGDAYLEVHVELPSAAEALREHLAHWPQPASDAHPLRQRYERELEALLGAEQPATPGAEPERSA